MLAQESLGHTSTKYGTTRWKEMWRCGRAHYLRYKLGLRSLEAVPALAIGTAVHAVLAYVSSAEMRGYDPEDVDWKLPLALTMKKRLAGSITAEVVSEANRIMSEYWRVHDRFTNAGWPEDWKMVGVEVFVEDPSLPHTTQLDLVCRSKSTGKLIVINHKTAASMSKIFEQPPLLSAGEPFQAEDKARIVLTADAQALGEAHLASSHYGEMPIMCRHIITKAKKAKYSRILYEVTPFQLDRWLDSECTHRAIYDANEDLFDGLMNHNECTSSIGNLPCWALNYCHGSPEQQEELYEIRTKREDKDGTQEEGKGEGKARSKKSKRRSGPERSGRLRRNRSS